MAKQMEMKKQRINELNLAQLLHEHASTYKKLEILKDLDVNGIISGNSLATQATAFEGYNSLHIAIMKSDLDLTQKLLHLGANVLQQGVQDGKTPLRKAVDYVQNCAGTSVWDLIGVLQEHILVNTLLSTQVKNNNPLNTKCKSGISHLHIASMFNHAEAALFLGRSHECINQRVNVDSNKLPGYTPLHCAIRYSSSEVAVVLLTLGADIYLENVQNVNSVCYLIKRRLEATDYSKMANGWDSSYVYDKEIERLDSIIKVILLKNRADDSKLVKNTGLSAFHLACMLNDDWIMQTYLRHDFKDIDKPVTSMSRRWSGWTPLHFAACCNIRTFEALLNSGADIKIKNATGETAIDLGFQRFSPEELLEHLSLKTMLSDQLTKLSDIILTVSKRNTYLEFLENIKDPHLSVPFEAPFWAGYNLLHMSMSSYHRRRSSSVFCEKTDYYPKGVLDWFKLRKTFKWEACYYYWSKIEMTLKKGCSIYSKNADDLTPIHLAFKLDEWHVLEELLARAHKDVVGPDNVSFLHIACAAGKVDVVERLLKTGCDVNLPVTSNFVWYKKPQSNNEMTYYSQLRKVSIRANSTPLHIAVIFKNDKVAEKLLENHADIQAQDELGLTPLHLSLTSTNIIIKLLLSREPNLTDIKTEDGLSHLHVAAYADDEKAMKKLLQNGADVNGYIKKSVPHVFKAIVGKTPLHLAITGEKATRLLIENGADVFAENPYVNYESPLDLVMRRLNSTQLNLFCEELKHNEVRIDALTASGITTLHLACATFDFDWAKTLLESEANPNTQMNDSRGHINTPMHLMIINTACRSKLPENFRSIIELLLEYGADVNINNNFKSLLHLLFDICLEKRWFDLPDDRAVLLTIADWLLSNLKSYEVTSTSIDEFSYFYFACITNNLPVVKKYLDNGIDINRQNWPFADKNSGFTPLHFAIMHKNIDVAQLLINRGADVKAEDTNGNTPLHLAIITQFMEWRFFAAMLRRGADINAKNLKDETPFECMLFHKNITFKNFYYFIKHGSLLDFTKMIYEGQGIIGYILSHTIPSDLEIIFTAFIDYCKFKEAITKGFKAIHNIVSVQQNVRLTCEHYLRFIQRLTEEGSDIDEQDENGKTALDKAIFFNNPNAIEALLMLGANVDIHEDRFYWYSTSEERNLLKKHLYKMAFLKLDLSISNKKLLKNEEGKPSESAMYLYQSELEKIKLTKIFDCLSVKNFLSEWGAVIEYRTMLVAERQAVDNFFKSGDDLRNKFPHFAGLLIMQYRKALARIKLIQPVKNILVVAGIDLPELCLEAILVNLKNSELNFLIENVNEEFFL